MANLITVRGDRSLRSLIDTEGGTVSRELYVNEDIFEQEQEQIFGRCWLFLGHESQVPNPGRLHRYPHGHRRGAGGARGARDNQIRAFLNSCAHRGMKVCRYDQGNSLVFTCPFHAWTYDCNGALVGAAYQYAPYAYDGGHRPGAMGAHPGGAVQELLRVALGDMGPEGPLLRGTTSGRSPRAIRYDCEASDGEEAGIEVFRPFQKWRLPTNWKVPAFSSSTDLTHAAMTHRFRQRRLHRPRPEAPCPAASATSAAPPSRPTGTPSATITSATAATGRSTSSPAYRSTSTPGLRGGGVDEYFREARERKARKYADRILPPHGHEGGHFCVFPNFIMDSWRWRWWHPHTRRRRGAVGGLFGVDREAPKHVKDAVRHYVMRYNGPTGATESDDMENWNYVYSASQGARARKRNYFFANGLGRGIESEQYPGIVFNGSHTEEAGTAARFSRWLAFMEASSWDDLYPSNRAKSHRISVGAPVRYVRRESPGWRSAPARASKRWTGTCCCGSIEQFPLLGGAAARRAQAHRMARPAR